jgi:uncharacterized RDD family membrane protein YckC
VSDDPPQPYGAPPEGQDQPPPGQYQPPAPYQPPPGGYQPPGQYQPPAPYQPPPGGYPPPPPPGGFSSPGGYPPPPPPGGGYPPPAGGYSGGYAPPPPPGSYGGAPGPTGFSPSLGAPLAEWPQRALGLLIDWGIGLGIGIVTFILGAILGSVSNGLFVLVRIIGGLASLAWVVWLSVQVGGTGQSPGMRTIGLKAVRKDTGAPIGAGMGVVRWLVHVVLYVACVIPVIVDFLFPLWDPSKQTLADKAASTVVIVVPKQAFSLQPARPRTY